MISPYDAHALYEAGRHHDALKAIAPSELN